MVQTVKGIMTTPEGDIKMELSLDEYCERCLHFKSGACLGDYAPDGISMFECENLKEK